MTDHETIRSTLARAGITYKEDFDEDEIHLYVYDCDNHPSIYGYMMFFVDFVFNFKGELIKLGAWE